ncbi:LacI family DNA-binding transcriptional regulator [Salipaludibacillus aurantiacus]|uniref:LacI family transcriptional regulator, sucrose operon repressor n=1 Tax=Salipaludibacillus aurantiacus TaxID=1601833 RepID=A0A1H9PHR3_9BACI|nr:LacI family DNA-binding transcriptional regulator [Salipaludibacillus aurantiacus]SER47826.1 LacI family transcriptional regulator, sucrose operon repressor [Salipaludibacillus aurantiacus]
MATIKDIAIKAGVSVTSVSRVLNRRGYLSEELINKVHQAMEELHYQPNEVARSLQKKESRIIGLILPDVSHPFFGELTRAIESYAFSRNYKLLLCNSQLDPLKEKDYLSMLKASQVDGIIMGSHTIDTEEYLHIAQPLVTIDRRISSRIPYVSSDNFEGGVLAAEKLIKKGCKQIAYIGGNVELDLLAKKRYEGFKKEIDHSKCKLHFFQTNINGFNYEEYEELAAGIFRECPEIDGIFASSDIIAAAILKEARRLNRGVPQDVKVIGYDNVQLSRIISPPLTTIGQPIKEIGEKAVDLIISQIRKERVTVETVLPVQLIERETT